MTAVNLDVSSEKKCSRCQEFKSLAEFNKDKSKKDGYMYLCKLCDRQADLDRRKQKGIRQRIVPIKQKTSKQCTKCKEIKPHNLFQYAATKRDKLTSHCKQCLSEADRFRASQRRYGITYDAYLELVKNQDDKCAICSISFNDKSMRCIDHDHKCCPTLPACGKCVRGILCQSCNSGIGYLKDDLNLLRCAVSYLSRVR